MQNVSKHVLDALEQLIPGPFEWRWSALLHTYQLPIRQNFPVVCL